ncbi:hypothetical protein CK203_054732 [Vitis vinifera]|uniref:Uncharacterized protein n=1 Tax=Vitis vinifera TaxID=29760 RepID=A0A438H1U9_VITVI|nr:hypothetical protein CK203_054732 [Vitis vinifera]
MHDEGTKNDILSCERSLEDKDNKNGNEHYIRTLSIEKLCTEDLNGKNEDACATSIKVEFCQMFFKLYDIGKDVFQFSIDWAPSIPTQENGLV